MLPNLAAVDRAIELAHAIQDTLRRPIEVDGAVLRLRASLGISIAPEHGEETSVLMRRADLAMYLAKSDGGAGMAVYDPEVGAEQEQRSARRRATLSILRAPRTWCGGRSPGPGAGPGVGG